MNFINKEYIKIGPAIVNSLKERLFVICIKQFIKKWHKQNKNYHGNKNLFLRQYFKLLVNRCIDEYNKEEMNNAKSNRKVY